MHWAEKIFYAAINPRGTLRFLANQSKGLFVRRHHFPSDGKDSSKAFNSGLPELNEVRARSRKRSHLSDHLVPLFLEALSARPRLMVELGVGGGESTFVLERVARLCRSRLVGVDTENCSGAGRHPDWVFVQGDDVAFAPTFGDWCRQRNIEPRVDVLFIDTSHLFEHTCREIEGWFPYLAGRSKVFFHDTNLKKVCFRRDGSIAFAWDNQRGVIRAIEQFLGSSFNEEKDFVEVAGGWLVKHYACCAGFTILEKLGPRK